MNGMSGWRKGEGALLLVAGCLLTTVGTATADDRLLLELKARLDNLEKQNQELKAKLDNLDAKPGTSRDDKKDEKKGDQDKEGVKKAIDDYMKDRDKKKKEEDDKKKHEAEEKGYEVGKHLDFKAKWNNGLWFETEDKAFRVHVGGRTQLDAVAVHAPANVRAPLSQAGIGEFDDAVNFRRARLAIEGTFWEVLDFNCEYDFLNTVRVVPGGNVNRVADATGNQTLNNLAGTLPDRANVINTPVPTDLWIQWKAIPYIGNIRFGNQKPWYSFEHMTSSRFLDFMERSFAFDAFVENGDNGFTPGISVFNNVLEDRLNYGVGVYKVNTRDIFGWNVGDGEYQAVARVWGTPLYSDGGRCMIHAGLGVTHRGRDDGTIRYRARTLLRNGPAVLHNTVAIIQANAGRETIVVPEVAINYGAFNLSAEYYGTWAYQNAGGAFSNVGNQGAGLPSGGRGQLFYQGGYVTAGYFLTGEHRSYNKKNGAWDRQAVNEYAFFVDGKEGVLTGRGAWEVLARYSWLDLDSKGVNGGRVDSLTVGLNWFLNPNAKIQFNYEIAYRDATQYAGGVIVNNSRDGTFQGVGTRFAFDF